MIGQIRVSYTDPDELQEVVKRLQPVKKVKISKNEQGGYRKAYIELAIEKSIDTPCYK
ncbi:MAG: hypothetical protein K0S76_731 [Herbinix sp.]|jgi:hypothetical protein|nr:hypothetical protein [Herbinix sp.]